MRPSAWEPAHDAFENRPTLLAHALALSALHGPGPWPDSGYPLPDEKPRANDGEPYMPSVVLDGIRTHHFGTKPAPAAASELAEFLGRLTAGPSPAHKQLLELHERLAAQSPVDIADDLVAELRRQRPPKDRLRLLARHLIEYGTQRNTVKLGIAVLGCSGDERDRDLLLLMGALEEFTLYAVVALMNTQPDRQRAVYELARRVSGWGRIHAVERLEGCDDPEIKSWLLREGFRNGVMDEYLAHLAATTGGLYMALLEPSVDDALLDGAGRILAALAVGGPAQDMRDYPDAVPAMHRYAELAAEAVPTLQRLTDLLTVGRFVREPFDGFAWPEGEPDRLAARYDALLDRPVWRDIVLAHLAHPVGPYGFNHALSCAGRLGMDVLPRALKHLAERDPLNSYVWQWAVGHAGADTIGAVVAQAERLLPLADLASGPADSSGWGSDLEADRTLGIIVARLDRYPGQGLALIRTALANRVVWARRGALSTLAAWPSEVVPTEALDWVAASARAEPDNKLREEMQAFLSQRVPG